jgi:hypothetical protein
VVVVLKKGDLTQEEADAIAADSAGNLPYKELIQNRMISVRRGGSVSLSTKPVFQAKVFRDYRSVFFSLFFIYSRQLVIRA